MPFEKGNQARAKDRIWLAAIDKALEKRGGQLGRMGALVELADKLLDKVQEGDISAIRELGDRLEGKPKQQLDVAGNLGVEVNWPVPKGKLG